MKLYCRAVVLAGVLMLLLGPAPGAWAGQQPHYLAVDHREGGITILVATDNSLRVAGYIDVKDVRAGFVDGPSLYVVTWRPKGEQGEGLSPTLLRYNLTNPEKPVRDLTLSLPPIWAEALYVRDQSVFVGGSELVHLDLTKPNPEPKVLISREDFGKGGKGSIDALAAPGDRLYAVDTTFTTLYVYLFDIADPVHPKPLGKYGLGLGIYSKILGAAASPQHLLVLRFDPALPPVDGRYMLYLYHAEPFKKADHKMMSKSRGLGSPRLMLSVALVNETAYVVSRFEGLIAVPIKDGKFQNSRIVLQKKGLSYMTARGNRLYVVSDNNTVLAVDVVGHEPPAVSTVHLERKKANRIW